MACLLFLVISASGKQFREISIPSSSCIFSVAGEIAKTVSDSEVILHILGFPGGSDCKESACNVEDPGLIPGSGRSLGEGHSYPFQYSCLENSTGLRNLVGYSPWGCKELETTEQ